MLNRIWESLLGVLASLVFSVPTAILLWMLINHELFHWQAFLASDYLLLIVGVFALLALILPNLFPVIMERIWRSLIQWLRWF